MGDFVLKYADGRGQIRQQVATAGSEKELRERFSQQGFLIYSIKPRTAVGALASRGLFAGRKKLNLERFLIFNQQFVTLIRAGLPILKGLDLLAERLTDPKLGPYVKAVRDEVRNGTLLSEAFRQQGIFPKIYVTSVMAGEKSGSLTEVLDRYIVYQKLSLAVRKKVISSLVYPCLLICLVIGLMVFMVTYVVPTFATLYTSMSATLPVMTQYLIAIGTTARTICVPPFESMPVMRPRRLFMSPIRSPANSTGPMTSTFMIGSSRTALACSMASLKALRAASLNDISEESTSWYWPSYSVTWKSTIG